MFPERTTVVRAESLGEAADLLDEHGPDAQLLAGGQSLIPLMKLRLATPGVLVDVSHLTPERPVRFGDGDAVVHALTTHAEALGHGRLTDRFQVIADAVPQIADPQIRNMGTVGGSLAHADPSGDWGPIALVTGATIRTVSPGGGRDIPAAGFYEGPFQTALGDDEVVGSVSLPRPGETTGGAYLKIKRRQGVYAVASVGVQVELEDGVCVDVGHAVNSVAATYVSPPAVNEVLVDEAITPDRIEAAGGVLADHLETVADTRGSTGYKRESSVALFERAVETAHRRAQGETIDPSPMGPGGVMTNG